MPDEPFETILAETNLPIVDNIFSGIGENFIFEFELDQPEPVVDFSTCILKNEMPALLDYWQTDEMRKLLTANDKWQKILGFCSRWNNRGTRLNTHVKNIWFEFDNIQLSRELPEPCLFFSTRLLNPGKLNVNWLFQSALDILMPEKMADDFIRNVKNCIRALPANGAVFQTGVLLSRNTDGLRLCTTMAADNYQKYLEKIKWPGSFEYLVPAIQTFGQYADAVFVDIDVGREVSAKIGMECCFRNDGDVKRKVTDFFDLLIELDLCTGKNAKQVMDWINCSGRGEMFFKKKGLERGLSHIKIILNEDNTAAAKAYLSLSNRRSMLHRPY